MMAKIIFGKGAAKTVKSTVSSSLQARRLARALVDLQSNSLEDLQRAGKVKKLRVVGNNNVYVFRIGPSERIIFSPIHGENIIHDVIDMRKNRSIVKPYNPNKE